MAFLRGRGTQMRVGEGVGDGVGGRAWVRLQYSSSWLPTLLGGSVLHFPWLPPPLLVRRYDVVFSELKRCEITEENTTFSQRTVMLAGMCCSSDAAYLTGPMWFWEDVGVELL